jgi:RNA polymerase sigma-70 factor, ECF subfamily
MHAMQRLTPHERIVFELKHFDGMILRTISEILNTSEGEVRNSLARVMRKLRSNLGRASRKLH